MTIRIPDDNTRSSILDIAAQLLDPDGFEVPEDLDSIRALRACGYAVIVWSPEELGDADPKAVQDRSIELGWDIINDLQATADGDCTSFVIELFMANGEWERVDYIEDEDGSRTINTYPTRAAAQAELDSMQEEMTASNMYFKHSDWRVVPE